jgi:N-acetylmuramoyl-L-alanine amidase
MYAASPTTSVVTIHVVVMADKKTRLTFELTAPGAYHLFTLSNPERIALDFPQVSHAKPDFTPAALSKTSVQNIRSAWHPQTHFLRVVLDLRQPVIPHAALLHRSGNKYQLIVDLFPQAITAPITKNAQPTSSASPKKLMAALPPPAIFMAPVARRPIIIVIDAGHGGKDPGTTGVGGTHEKDVVMDIARSLQQNLNRLPGFHAVLTREGDYYIPLRERLIISRRDKADMFISIHADAYKNHTETGASVFALSERGATSEAARWLAEKENHSELAGGWSLPVGDPALRSVLMDLTQTHTIDESLQMGAYLLQQLREVTPLRHKQIEQAAFVVLKSPDIPSLLVETGFLSTPSQERKLRNPYFQQQIAKALALGISRYFIQHPPPEISATKPAAHTDF